MSDKLYQVFISSTYDDLHEERKSASTAVAKAGFFVSGMELFPATSVSQLDYIRKMIDRCDYYVLIIAGRYGSIGENGISFTEEEYNYAKSIGKPILAFVHNDIDKLERRKIELDKKKRQLLDAFRTSAKSGRIVEFWSDPAELAMKVAIGLQQATYLTPQTGWVRGDRAASIELFEEIERLRIENRNLLDKIKTLIDGDANTVKMTDSINLNISIICSYTDTRTSSQPIGSLSHTRSEIFCLNEIYEELFERFSRQPTSEDRIAKTIVSDSHGSQFVAPPENNYLVSYTEQIQNIHSLRLHFAAAGMIDIYQSRDSFSYGNNVYIWEATEKGRRYGYNLLARRISN